jgi:hypothetical protein
LSIEISSDASKQFDAVTAAKMVAAAVEYRQVEKNTPPVRIQVLSIQRRWYDS